MSASDSRKQSIYLPEEILTEIRYQAERQDRSISWLIQQAWKTARESICSLPSVDEVLGELHPR